MKNIATQLVATLSAEVKAWAGAFLSPVLYALLAFLLAGFWLAAQMPITYSIDVGVEEGYGSDRPMLEDFNTPERDRQTRETYRWTADQATVTLPGLGQRAVMVRMDFLPISAEAAARGPQEINIWAGDELHTVLPVRWEGASYRFLVPERLMQGGVLALTIRTHTFQPASSADPRALGTPLNRITVSAASGFRPAGPDRRAVALWLLAAVLCWAVVRRALAAVPQSGLWATGFAAIVAPLLVLAAVLDPPRWAFGARPALLVAAACVLLLLLLRPAFALLAARLDIPLNARSMGWLLLIVLVAFGLRYGGRLYPRSMHGDIGFHTNRFYEVAGGRVYLLSRNRGINFPYPPGPYLLLAPFTLIKPDPPDILQFGAALVEGLGAALVYTIVARTGKVCSNWRAYYGRYAKIPMRAAASRASISAALLAAAIYGFAAAGLMTTWWSFDTHIYTQFFTVLLITALVECGLRLVTSAPAQQHSPAAGRWAFGIFVLCALVFLGHFGFLINTVLLGGLLLLLVWAAAWRGAAWARLIHLPLTLAGIGAGAAAILLFYSFYTPLFLEQAQGVAAGGLTGLAERAPVPRAYLWHILWNAGLIDHFGFFPLLLAPAGGWLLTKWGRPALVPVALMGGSLLISLAFAVLPFITLSTQSTRWLMFSAWAVAIGAALAARSLWGCGHAGRVVVATMGGFVVWNTLVFWLEPMLWRIRPPEPF